MTTDPKPEFVHRRQPADDSWMKDAWCKSRSHLFWSADPDDRELAIRKCNTACPVRAECEFYVLDTFGVMQPDGIWAGMELEERKRLARKSLHERALRRAKEKRAVRESQELVAREALAAKLATQEERLAKDRAYARYRKKLAGAAADAERLAARLNGEA